MTQGHDAWTFFLNQFPCQFLTPLSSIPLTRHQYSLCHLFTLSQVSGHNAKMKPKIVLPYNFDLMLDFYFSPVGKSLDFYVRRLHERRANCRKTAHKADNLGSRAEQIRASWWLPSWSDAQHNVAHITVSSRRNGQLEIFTHHLSSISRKPPSLWVTRALAANLFVECISNSKNNITPYLLPVSAESHNEKAALSQLRLRLTWWMVAHDVSLLFPSFTEKRNNKEATGITKKRRKRIP